METAFHLEGAIIGGGYLDWEEELALSLTSKWLLGIHANTISSLGIRSPHERGSSQTTSEPHHHRRSTTAGSSTPQQLGSSTPWGSQAVYTLLGWSDDSTKASEPPPSPRLTKGPVPRLLARYTKLQTLRLLNPSSVAPSAVALGERHFEALTVLIVTKVSAEGLLDAAQLLSAALPHLPALQRLDLSHNCCQADVAEALGACLGRGDCPKLQDLGLGGWSNRVGRSGWLALARGMQRRYKLQRHQNPPPPPSSVVVAPLSRLSLGGEEAEMVDGALDDLWPAVLPALVSLELWCGGVGRSAMSSLGRGLQLLAASSSSSSSAPSPRSPPSSSRPGLKELRVRSKKVGGVCGVDKVVEAVVQGGMARTLEVVELWQCSVGREAVTALAGGQWASLRELLMQNVGLGDEEMEILRDGALGSGAASSVMQVLDLGMNSDLGGRGAAALGQALAQGGCPTLQVLELGETSIADEGLVSLSRALRSAPCGMTLTRLGLRCSKAGAVGVRTLMEVVMGPGLCLRGLQELHLEDNSMVGDEGVVSIVMAMEWGAMEELRVLDVRGVGMGTRGAGELARVVANGGGRMLRSLWVGGGGEEGVAVKTVGSAGQVRRQQQVESGEEEIDQQVQVIIT